MLLYTKNFQINLPFGKESENLRCLQCPGA